MRRLADCFFLFLLLFTAARASSEETVPSVVFPAIPAQARAQADLVPKGWTVEMESRGDLNGDGVPDLMLVLHMTDPRNVITTSQTRFTFRYQDGCFKLIGYDSTEMRRNSGETSAVSINYLTKKAKISKGNIENDREDVSWKAVRIPSLPCLEAVGNGLEFDPGIADGLS